MQGDDYSIEQENVACSGAISKSLGFGIGSAAPSCTKTVTIRFKKTAITLKQGKEVITIQFKKEVITMHSD